METIIGVGAGAIIVLLLIIWISVSLYRKVGPNQALIVYGRGGTQVAVGGGRIVWPFIQNARELSLELMSFDVAPQQDMFTSQGVAVTVEAVAQIKIKNDPVSIRTAAEQLLNKSAAEREGLIRLVMEGHLRGITGQLTVEQIVKEPEMVGDRMRATSSEDVNKMGLEVVSFTIREVRDKNEYISNMGKPDIARIKRDADVASAEAERDTSVRRAETLREASVARAAADQARVIAETASQTRQAEATRDLELKRAEYDASVQRQKATADKAYDIQTAVMDQQVTAEKVRIDRVRKEEEIKVQDAEIERREKELIATIQKQAEAERKRIEILAEAERQRQILEATGHAEATSLQGNADATVIRLKGEAEATSMRLKAEAYLEYNQAALLDKLFNAIPELAKAISEPLSKVDKITIVSTGEGSKGGFGANQITGDMTKMMAQMPAVIESLTGLKIQDLLMQVPTLKAAMNGNKVNGTITNGNGNGTVDLTKITTTTVEAVPEEPSAN